MLYHKISANYYYNHCAYLLLLLFSVRAVTITATESSVFHLVFSFAQATTATNKFMAFHVMLLAISFRMVATLSQNLSSSPSFRGLGAWGHQSGYRSSRRLDNWRILHAVVSGKIPSILYFRVNNMFSTIIDLCVTCSIIEKHHKQF